MLQCEGEAPAGSQKGLRPTLAAGNYFLACQAHPTSTIRIQNAEGPKPVDCVVRTSEVVGEGVARLTLQLAAAMEYKPGQYLDVIHPDGTRRSYSIASLPEDGVIEMHVRRVDGGKHSSWLHGLVPGDQLQVRGPFGQCFHMADDDQRKLLLIGAGTGLAPLIGIARDALGQGHQGQVILLHGGLQPNRLYLRDRLSELEQEWPNFDVHHCVLQDATEEETQGDLDKVAIEVAGDLGRARAFLCGDDTIVQKLQRSLFLAGMPSREILADPFSPQLS